MPTQMTISTHTHTSLHYHVVQQINAQRLCYGQYKRAKFHKAALTVTHLLSHI